MKTILYRTINRECCTGNSGSLLLDTVRDLFIRRMDGWRELCIWTGTGGREGGAMPLSAKSRRSPRSAFRIRAVCGRAGSAADLVAEPCKPAAKRKKDMRTAICLIGVRIPFICLKIAFSTIQQGSFVLLTKTTHSKTNNRIPQTHQRSQDRELPPVLTEAPYCSGIRMLYLGSLAFT